MNDADKNNERRRFTRVPINVEIYCGGETNVAKKGKGLISFFATDISVGGVFIESSLSVALGSTIFLRFQLPGAAKPVYLMGKIVRHQMNQANRLEGMGIEFINMGISEKILIEDYINRIKA